MKQGPSAARELFPTKIKQEPYVVSREEFLCEQRFLMQAVGDRGKQLWKSLVIERQLLLQNISQMQKQTESLDALLKQKFWDYNCLFFVREFKEFDSQLKLHLSRRQQEPKPGKTPC
jgi:hypothetical protein